MAERGNFSLELGFVEQELKEIAYKTMSDAKKGFWLLFEHLLATSLVAGWQTIIKLECATGGHVYYGGMPKTGKHGKDFVSNGDWGVYTWLQNVVKVHSAKRHCS